MSELTVVIGAGSIGQAIARRVSAGKHVLLADLHQSNADSAAAVLQDAGFEVSSPDPEGRATDACSSSAPPAEPVPPTRSPPSPPSSSDPTAPGSDFLIDGGVTASYFYGPLAPS